MEITKELIEKVGRTIEEFRYNNESCHNQETSLSGVILPGNWYYNALNWTNGYMTEYDLTGEEFMKRIRGLYDSLASLIADTTLQIAIYTLDSAPEEIKKNWGNHNHIYFNITERINKNNTYSLPIPQKGSYKGGDIPLHPIKENYINTFTSYQMSKYIQHTIQKKLAAFYLK